MIEILPLASGSKGNCYRITDGRAPLLLECGIPFREIQKGLNFRTSELAGVLVSHEHKDHSKAVRDMMKAGIDCYMSQGTAEALRVSGHRLHIVKAKQQFRVGTWTILPFDTVHDASEPLGFLLASGKEKLLFATDTSYIRYRFKGLTHIMIEANYQREILEHGVEEGLDFAVLVPELLFFRSSILPP
jgi:phosphoribosyl 1,2-cyclic phosphodiesterase